MQRFFYTTLSSDILVLTEKKIYHQITHVLRMKYGEKVIFFSGNGQDCVYTLQKITKKELFFQKQTCFQNTVDPERKIILCQAIPNKQKKLEFLVQKGVEVGISGFFFFYAQRSNQKQISAHAKERLSFIAKEALEQCGGNLFPKIIWDFCSLEAVFEYISTFYKKQTQEAAKQFQILVCDTGNKTIGQLGEKTCKKVKTRGNKETIKEKEIREKYKEKQEEVEVETEKQREKHEIFGYNSVSNNFYLENRLGNLHNTTYLFIGPEGGFCEEERALYKKYDFHVYQTGRRILRTETAGPVIAFHLLHQ